MGVEYPYLNHLDLTEQTYRILREQILRRQLQPGERISVEDVAQGIGVSRTPVVNALQKLETDGLVEIRPRRGTFVTQLTARDVADLFEVRLLIELHAAEQVFKNGKVDEVLADIQEPIQHMQSAITEDEYIDYELFISSDRDLHTRLVRVINNRRLNHIYNELNVHMRVARAHYLNTVENAHQAHVEHVAMVKALENHDLESLKKALEDHINNVSERILDILDERGGKL